jgi:hypothetical protein
VLTLVMAWQRGEEEGVMVARVWCRSSYLMGDNIRLDVVSHSTYKIHLYLLRCSCVEIDHND